MSALRSRLLALMVSAMLRMMATRSCQGTCRHSSQASLAAAMAAWEWLRSPSWAVPRSSSRLMGL